MNNWLIQYQYDFSNSRLTLTNLNNYKSRSWNGTIADQILNYPLIRKWINGKTHCNLSKQQAQQIFLIAAAVSVYNRETTVNKFHI